MRQIFLGLVQKQVMLCERERGKLTWADTTRIDRIRRAHAQKHQNKQNWGTRMGEKHPWFWKNFQMGSCTYNKDHETGGKLQKHICAFWLGSINALLAKGYQKQSIA